MQEVAALMRAAVSMGVASGSTSALPVGSGAPQIAHLPSPAPGNAGARPPSHGGTYALTPDPTVGPRSVVDQGTTFGTAAVAVSRARENRASKTPVVGGAIVGVAAVAGVIAWYVSSRPAELPAPVAIEPAAATSSNPPRDPVTAPLPAVPQEVRIAISSSPTDARVWVGHEVHERGRTPLDLKLRAGEGEVRLRLEHDGYLPKTLPVPTDRDGAFEVQLEKVAKAKPRPSARPRPQPAVEDEEFRALIER